LLDLYLYDEIKCLSCTDVLLFHERSGIHMKVAKIFDSDHDGFKVAMSRGVPAMFDLNHCFDSLVAV